MRLELAVTTIKEVRLGDETRVRSGTLTVNARELRELLLEDGRLGDVRIEVANPGDDCRIAGVFDVIEPRARSGGGDYPGALGPIAPVGNGRTHVLRGAAVIEVNGTIDGTARLIDMSGSAAAFSPFSQTANVAVIGLPAQGIDRQAFNHALKIAGLKAGVYLANCVKDLTPDAIEMYAIDDQGDASNDLPRIAYIYMLHSNQFPAQPDEPIFYGDNVRGLMPTILHPNEVLDGAVVAGYWGLGNLTYTIQNSPVITALYARHRQDLILTGVIVNVAYPTLRERQRSTMTSAKLARHVLKADGALLTKVGGGIPETDLMLTCERCEELGVKTAMVISQFLADGTALTFHSPKADALVMAGFTNATVQLPAKTRVIGPDNLAIRLASNDTPVGAVPTGASGETRVANIAGGLCQLGSSALRTFEY